MILFLPLVEDHPASDYHIRRTQKEIASKQVQFIENCIHKTYKNTADIFNLVCWT
jgi:hypothetical protein